MMRWVEAGEVGAGVEGASEVGFDEPVDEEDEADDADACFDAVVVVEEEGADAEGALGVVVAAFCWADPPQLHGPYLQWSRAVNGKTVTKVLTPEQLRRYQPWFDNGRRLRELAHELNELSLTTIRTLKGWGR